VAAFNYTDVFVELRYTISRIDPRYKGLSLMVALPQDIQRLLTRHTASTYSK